MKRKLHFDLFSSLASVPPSRFEIVRMSTSEGESGEDGEENVRDGAKSIREYKRHWKEIVGFMENATRL